MKRKKRIALLLLFVVAGGLVFLRLSEKPFDDYDVLIHYTGVELRGSKASAGGLMVELLGHSRIRAMEDKLVDWGILSTSEPMILQSWRKKTGFSGSDRNDLAALLRAYDLFKEGADVRDPGGFTLAEFLVPVDGKAHCLSMRQQVSTGYYFALIRMGERHEDQWKCDDPGAPPRRIFVSERLARDLVDFMNRESVFPLFKDWYQGYPSFNKKWEHIDAIPHDAVGWEP